ncbi:MAG: hypothetical protein KDN19_10255 [Verrucomicrobiae bacterium]|nr:hypothetical protein [Verrucomicrobiae bacterium]
MKMFRRLALIPRSLLCLSLVAFATAANASPLQLGKVGPWGQLESYEIVLEPADQLIREPLYTYPPLIWAFPPDWDLERIGHFLTRSGIAPAEVAAMLESGTVKHHVNATTLLPTARAIIDLNPQQRAALYAEFSKWGINPFQTAPFSLGGDNVSSLAALATHPFPEDFLKFADKFVFEGSPRNLLSDYPLLCTELPDEVAVRIRFAKLLLRSRALMVRLRIPEGTSLDEVRKYWTLDGKIESSLPALNAAFPTDDPAAAPPLDLVHLLPPLPRQLLYTYSPVALAVGEFRPDCFWSSLNFFEEDFSQRYLDPIVGELLGSEWIPVEKPYRFGDLILIKELRSGDAVHACNYLADDLVFTKNGKSFLRPWLIQPISEVEKTYSVDGFHQTAVYRHRRFLPRQSSSAPAPDEPTRNAEPPLPR